MITDHMGHYLISCQPLHPLVIMKKNKAKIDMHHLAEKNVYEHL